MTEVKRDVSARRWRRIALFGAGVAIGATIAATPVSGHVGGTVAHLWSHLMPLTNDRYYTKTRADNRFYNTTETVANATNAERLGGSDAADYLKGGSTAAGDLSGTYPNPSIADGAVGPAKIGTIPAVRAYENVAQVAPNGAAPTVPFDSEQIDTQNLHDRATHNERLVAPVAGVYQVDGEIAWASNATGFRQIFIWRDFAGGGFGGVVASSNVQAVSGERTIHSASGLVRLGAGDYVYMTVQQNSGRNLEYGYNQGVVCGAMFAMHWVGP